MRKVLFLLTTLVVFFQGKIQSQTLQNIHASFDGEKILVTYDLIDPDPGQRFNVALYSSHDNYTTLLTALTGDAGDAVLPGKNKSVNWNAKSSLVPNFDNIITIKVKALKIVKVVQVADPPPASTTAKLVMQPFTRSAYKRGEEVDLRWSGGYGVKKISIVLLKDNVVQTKIADNIENTQKYAWKVPKKNRTGKNYSIQVIDTGQAGAPSSTPLFTIRPRTSLLVKVLPIAAVAGAAGILFLGANKAPDVLPGPINPN
jgi:hypothetical protein